MTPCLALPAGSDRASGRRQPCRSGYGLPTLRFWLSRRLRNKLAHAYNGNTAGEARDGAWLAEAPHARAALVLDPAAVAVRPDARPAGRASDRPGQLALASFAAALAWPSASPMLPGAVSLLGPLAAAIRCSWPGVVSTCPAALGAPAVDGPPFVDTARGPAPGTDGHRSSARSAGSMVWQCMRLGSA